MSGSRRPGPAAPKPWRAQRRGWRQLRPRGSDRSPPILNVGLAPLHLVPNSSAENAKLGDLLLGVGEHAELQPDAEIAGQLAVTCQDKSAILTHSINGPISEPDLGHASQVRRHVKVHVKSGIDEAEIDLLAGLDNEPIGPLRHRPILEDELNGVAA